MWSTVLIHKHHAGLSPRLIPGSSPRSVLQCFCWSLFFLSSNGRVSTRDFSGLELLNVLSISIGEALMHVSRHREFFLSVGEHQQRFVFP